MLLFGITIFKRRRFFYTLTDCFISQNLTLMKYNLLIIAFLINSFSLSIFSQPNGSLEFDFTKEHHVNHGIFWKPGVNHGNFFWEAWVKPNVNAQYVISDGYGGQHALLFGFSGGTTQLALTGNLWDITTNMGKSFGTDETVPVNQWCHIAVGWDGQKIVTFINGVPSGIVPYSGQRSTTPGSGAGVLFVGGSDHNNFNGKIARIRGFEGSLPMDSLLNSFTPEIHFRNSYLKSNGEIVTASFLADYSLPLKTYPDLSLGYQGVNHTGVLSRGVDIGFFGFKPNFLTNLPNWTPEPVTSPVYLRSTVPIPAGAKVYDSFNRADSTPAFNSVGLSSADKGFDDSRAGKRWNGTSVNQWGILSGRALNTGPFSTPVWIETGSPNMDVRATRLRGNFGTGNIELVYRYQDDSNYGRIYVSNGIIYLIEIVNGSYSLVLSANQPSPSWNELKVVANGNQVSVYCDSTQIITTASKNLTTATKAGMLGSSGTGERFDNFTVYTP